MKTIICIGGYSGSGKSTTIDTLESLGVPTFSASRFLHETVDRANCTMFQAIDPFGIGITDRAQCICMAEEVLIPVFGRALFAHAMMDGILKSDRDLVAIESIGGEEWDEFEKLTRSHSVRLIRWNVRSVREKPGIDIRKLIPDGYDIWNDETIEDWREYIENQVYFLKGGTN